MLFCLALKVGFICLFLNYQPLKSRGGYVYPDWSYHLGLATALSSMVAIPIYATAKLCFTKGTLRQVRVNLCRTLQIILSPLLVIISNWICLTKFCLTVVFHPLWSSQRLLVLWYPDRGAVHPTRNKHESETNPTSLSDIWARRKCLINSNTTSNVFLLLRLLNALFYLISWQKKLDYKLIMAISFLALESNKICLLSM